MILRTILRHFIPLCALVLLANGCGRNVPLQPIAQDQMAVSLETAFKNAKPEVKSRIQSAVAAIKTNGHAQAFLTLQELSLAPELTDAQRPVVLRCLITLRAQVANATAPEQAVDAGVLQQYQSVK